MSQSRENPRMNAFQSAQQCFVGNVQSPSQIQQQLLQLQQNPFLSLYNVSGFQNNFYQAPNLHALQLSNNFANKENSLSFLPRPVIGNNSMPVGMQGTPQYNLFEQSSTAHSSPSMNSFTNKLQQESGLGNLFKGENELFMAPASSTPIKVDQKMKLLYGLQRVALRGCESAARIFLNHSKRPYFKKIDLLCDRLKQDLGVTDKAVVNINSHGVSWAIKDFIFVFNRIIGGWAILRDYFYSTSEGMNCVNESVDPNLAEHFMKWQEATEKLANSLVISFENLQNVNHRNSNRKVMKQSNSVLNLSSADQQINFQHIFDPLVNEDSEQVQLAGGYLKSAVYKPVSSSEGSVAPNTPSSTHNVDPLKLLFNEMQPENFYSDQSRGAHSMPLYKRCASDSSEKTPKKTNNRLKVNLTEKFEAVNLNNNMDEALFDYIFSCPETI